MTEYAIQVEGLGKKYRIGNHAPYARFTELLIGAAKAPFNIAKQKLASPAGSKTSAKPSEFWALQDVNFNIEPGEIVGIIGRNGAGKSTLLKLLSRITEPTTGRIRYRGRVGSLLEVGTGFHPELTGKDNIFLNGAILGMTRAEVRKKFDEIVAFSEVEKFLDTAVKHYSSGMYMRLAFAVAAHLEPEILLVDEVLAVGDAEFQKKCLGKMGEVAKTGRTILFVSHNMGAIMRLCSRAMVLSKGTVAFYGGVDEGVSIYSSAMLATAKENITERLDRAGSGTTRLTEVEYLNHAGERVDCVKSGDDLSIRLSYRSSLNAKLSNARISVLISSQEDIPLLLCSTELTLSLKLQIESTGSVICFIPRLPLSGGSYWISVYIESAGVITDYIQSASLLAVEDGDFYGSGVLYPPGWQGKTILIDHKWFFEEKSK